MYHVKLLLVAKTIIQEEEKEEVISMVVHPKIVGNPQMTINDKITTGTCHCKVGPLLVTNGVISPRSRVITPVTHL